MAYDVDSRRLSAVRTVGGTGTSVNTGYGYDALDRTTAISHASSGTYLATFTYAYDPGSRLDGETAGGVA